MEELTGSWTLRFDPKWGGPEQVEFSRLEDWTKRPEEGIRHYSGMATYAKRFTLPGKISGRVFLDLGTVKAIAEVRLNGHSLGTVWTAPWRVEVTAALRPAENALEIDVVNLWPNRLLGDALLPPEQRRTRTNIVLDPKLPLQSSGLLGPVVLRQETR